MGERIPRQAMQNDQPTLYGSILLVEDDDSHALLIKRALRDLCSRIEHTATAKEAEKALSEKSFDLIISDLNLPDSVKVQNVARFKTVSPATPIVVLTSSTALSDAVEAMKLGASDFIVKNFDSSFKEMLHLALSRVYASQQILLERKKLRREMEALRLAIESSQDGFAVSAPDGSVVYANGSFREFCRISGGDAASLLSFLGPSVDQTEKLRTSVQNFVKTSGPGMFWHTEVSLKGGKARAFDLSLAALKVSEGKSGGGSECVAWIRDITELKNREKFQKEILSATTHDLKGPLGAISLSAELLFGMLHGQERAMEIVKRISSASVGATNLIEEFLSARRIQEGTFILKPSKVEVSGIVRDVVSELEPVALVKKIDVAVRAPEEGINWYCDKMGIKRVLGNLLSNAVKYTPSGGHVSIEIGNGSGTLSIKVIDTGSGMEPAEASRIFERFTRLEKHSSIPGTGLGLFVVKSIVEAHGGKVEVTSEPGKGSCFEVLLPENPPVNDKGEIISFTFA